MSFNRVTLIGNLGDAPEVRNFEGGNSVANFSLATSETFKNKEGERVENTEWHNIVAWGKLAGIIEKFLRKGSKVMIEGSIKTEKWEAEDGTNRYKTTIVARNMLMLDKKPEGATAPTAAAPSQDEDDLPF